MRFLEKGKTLFRARYEQFRARYEQLNLKAAEDIEDQNEPINGRRASGDGMRPNCKCTTIRPGHATSPERRTPGRVGGGGSGGVDTTGGQMGTTWGLCAVEI